MKKSLFTLIIFGSCFFAKAQWTTNVSGDIVPNMLNAKVGIGTTTPRGVFDVAGNGDIYLSNNPTTGTGQTIYLPGHIFMAPYNGSDWTYLQSRRSDNSGSTNLMIRTWNAGALNDAMAITSNGRVGIGTASPQQKIHVKGGGLMSTDPNYENINVKMDGNSVPAIRFTRWIGSGSIQHNAIIGQFYNSGSGEYSFGIGTGYSAAGDQNVNNNILTATLGGNVGIGTSSPRSTLEVMVAGNNNTIQRGLTIQQSNPGVPNNSAGVSLDFGIGNNGVNNNIEGRIILKETYFSTRPKMIFSLWDENNNFQERMSIDTYGNVGIGTSAPDAKLTVKGNIHTNEVKVDLLGAVAPDYVFEKSYDLRTLEEVKTYIDKNKHLPEIPSAREMEANGVNLGEMNMLLLRKIEELTLYVIEQNKQIAKLQERSVSPDLSGKRIEELTLYVIELRKENIDLRNKFDRIEQKK